VLADGAFFDITSTADEVTHRFEIGYSGDSTTHTFSSPAGNDLVIRAISVPEPTSLVLSLAFCNVAAIIGRNRKRISALASSRRCTNGAADAVILLRRIGFDRRGIVQPYHLLRNRQRNAAAFLADHFHRTHRK
jgi:hypothetical protein